MFLGRPRRRGKDPARMSRRVGNRIAAGSRAFSVGTLLSRLLGLLRDMVCTWYFPAAALDSFYTAFTVPNLFRGVFGEGAANSAFIPLVKEAEAEGGSAAADDLTRAALRYAATWLIGILVVVEATCALWVSSSTTARLLMVTAPVAVSSCLSAILSARLYTQGVFFLPALSPAVLNAAWIAMVVVAGRFLGVYAAAAGATTGSLIQAITLYSVVKGKTKRVGGTHDRRKTAARLKRMVSLALTSTIGMVVSRAVTLVDRIIAMVLVGGGGVTALYVANRLLQAPLGTFGIAVSTAAFPAMAEEASAGRTQAVKERLTEAMQTGFFLSMPATVGLYLLGNEVVGLLFQHGAFTATMTERTAAALGVYAIGLCGMFWSNTLRTAFHAMQDMRTPVAVSILIGAVNVTLDLVLVWRWKETGIAAASAAAFWAGTAAYAAAFHNKYGKVQWHRMGASLARTIAASVGMGGCMWIVGRLWAESGSTRLLLMSVSGILVFICISLAVGSREMRSFLERSR